MVALVIDTGPLTHTSQINEMAFLQTALKPWKCCHPFHVYTELQGWDGNQAALTAPWIKFVDLDLEHDLLVAELQDELGGSGDKHRGEAECIALALQEGGQVHIDDISGNDLADDRGLRSWTTTELMLEGVVQRRVYAIEAAEYLQKLIDDGYRGLDVPSGEAFLTGYLPPHLRPKP